jgi:hypothetical protein
MPKKLVANGGAGKIKARLLTAGDVVPDPLRATVYGADRGASLVVESAEGVTTFPGFQGDVAVLARMKARVDSLDEPGDAPNGDKQSA